MPDDLNPDEIVEEAARHLRGADDAAGWLDAFAIFQAGLCAIGVIGLVIYGVTESEPGAFVAAASTTMTALFLYAVLRGFASLIWLKVDEVMMRAIDDE